MSSSGPTYLNPNLNLGTIIEWDVSLQVGSPGPTYLHLNLYLGTTIDWDVSLQVSSPGPTTLVPPGLFRANMD